MQVTGKPIDIAITILIPYYDGHVDTDKEASDGLQVYAGHLSIDTMVALAGHPNNKAVMIKRKNDTIDYLEVTNGPAGSQPLTVDPTDQYWENCEGQYFDDDDTGPPFVSYIAYHSQLMDVVNTPS